LYGNLPTLPQSFPSCCPKSFVDFRGFWERGRHPVAVDKTKKYKKNNTHLFFTPARPAPQQKLSVFSLLMSSYLLTDNPFCFVWQFADFAPKLSFLLS
ncbi:MAG: hypothetical protein ACK5K8_06645, partial [Pseudanabaena sp.]